jgi:hypothetical protein
VSVLSPDTKEDRALEGWKMENGELSMSLDGLNSYAVTVIDLKASGPTKS